MRQEEMHQEGFDAIVNTLMALYPEQDGLGYSTLLPYTLGGEDPLDRVEIWKSDRGIPHWHYVTYGFTELYEKESDNPKISGYGFELTFRLKRGEEDVPPVWPVNLLQNLARYVFSSGNVFGSGHHMSCNGPIALGVDTELTALGFRVDPELGAMETPNGHMVFLQAVAITEDEMDAMMFWNGEKFLGELERQIPLCITDLERKSQMKEQRFRTAWQAGMERDGSSTGFLYMDELKMEQTGDLWKLCLGAGHTHTLCNMLRARVGKGQNLYLQGAEQAVILQPGAVSGLSVEGGLPVIRLAAEALEELCSLLQPHAGAHQMVSIPMTVELLPTRITDRNGNVTKIIE